MSYEIVSTLDHKGGCGRKMLFVKRGTVGDGPVTDVREKIPEPFAETFKTLLQNLVIVTSPGICTDAAAVGIIGRIKITVT